jgi:sortase A
VDNRWAATAVPGWWQAADGRWYPPELHPSRRADVEAEAWRRSTGGPGSPVDAGIGAASDPPPAASDPRPTVPSAVTADPEWWQAANGRWYPPELHPANRSDTEADAWRRAAPVQGIGSDTGDWAESRPPPTPRTVPGSDETAGQPPVAPRPPTADISGAGPGSNDAAANGPSRTERLRYRRRARRRQRQRRALWWTGVATIACGVVLAADVGWFYYHSEVAGSALLQREGAAIAAARSDAGQNRTVPSADCQSFSDAGAQAQGLVSAPQIGMEAPVVAGDGDDQLNVAVGHATGSSWPGQPGTTLLAAHDVTYFSHINQLAVGSPIDFVTPCRTYVYRVTGHQVVQEGSPLYSSPNQSLLILETCFPANALFLTTQRYLVTAEFTDSLTTGQQIPAISPPPIPMVPVPAALNAQGLTLATNSVPLGVLDIQGTPSPSWEQSMAPYDTEAAALTEYFGAIRSAEQNQLAWWSAITKNVPMSAAGPLRGARISGYSARLNPVLAAQGSSFSSAELDSQLSVSGGSDPGIYDMQVTVTNEFGTLLITKWVMTQS